MTTSIFFTESKDFKLIKDRIVNQEDNYLVYVYADTTNVRIPRELIMELPRYGNNLIWVDTADMDASDLSHHIVLTIGQLVNPEEELDFYIVSKSSKLEKTIHFLRSQGIPAEMIAPAQDKLTVVKTKSTGRRGRPKKAKNEDQAVVKSGRRGRPKKVQAEPALPEETVAAEAKTGKGGRPKKVQEETTQAPEAVETPKKRRGRPSVAKSVDAEIVPAEPKKRGRKKIEKPVAAEKPKKGRKPAVKVVTASEAPVIKDKKPKKVKAEKKAKAEKKVKKAKVVQAAKPRKQRIDKEITEEMVQEKLNLYANSDSNASMVMSRLFSLKKVARPKFLAKLVDTIKDITLEDDTVAENIISKLQEMQVLETNADGRVFYKD